jgi:hypothetical protein
MEYENGCLMQAGDIVTIDDKYSGQVVASMDRSLALGFVFAILCIPGQPAGRLARTTLTAKEIASSCAHEH